jgi:GNAT superfamily N-acetyltransferase
LIIEKLSENRLDEFFEIVSKMVAESEFSYAKPEKQKILQLFKNPNAVAFLALENNQIIGFISGIVHEYFFSNRKRVSDLGFFVLPEYRGSRVALKLVKLLESWAIEKKAEELHLGQTTGLDIDKTKKFYERLGFKTVGFNTVKHLRE